MGHERVPAPQPQSQNSDGPRSARPGRLSGNVRTNMESSFQTSFADVNIHADSAQAQAMGAQAFTQGNDIHFAPSRYQPETQSGQLLLAHELSHVVQQRAGRVKGFRQAFGLPHNTDENLEREADAMAFAAVRGERQTPANWMTTRTQLPSGDSAPIQCKIGFEFQVPKSVNHAQTGLYKRPRQQNANQNQNQHQPQLAQQQQVVDVNNNDIESDANNEQQNNNLEAQLEDNAHNQNEEQNHQDNDSDVDDNESVNDNVEDSAHQQHLEANQNQAALPAPAPTEDDEKNALYEGDGWTLTSDAGDPEAVTKAFTENKEGFEEMQATMQDMHDKFLEWRSAGDFVELGRDFIIKIGSEAPIKAAPQATGGMGFGTLLSMMEMIVEGNNFGLQANKASKQDRKMFDVLKTSLKKAQQAELPQADALPRPVRGALALMATYVRGGQNSANNAKKGPLGSLYYGKNATPFLLRNTWQNAVRTLHGPHKETLKKCLSKRTMIEDLVGIKWDAQIFPKGLADVNHPENQDLIKYITLKEFIDEVKQGLVEQDDDDEMITDMFDNTARRDNDNEFPTKLGPRSDISKQQNQLTEDEQRGRLGVVLEFRRIGKNNQLALDNHKDEWTAFATAFFRALNSAAPREKKEALPPPPVNFANMRPQDSAHWETAVAGYEWGTEQTLIDYIDQNMQGELPNGFKEAVMAFVGVE